MDEARTSLRELGALFLRLGCTAFGGPAAHIAMIHDEVVVRRRWLHEQAFLDLVSAANLIPGPTSTELAIHVGWQRRRGPGLLVAGLAFIVPAMLITLGFAWIYVRHGHLPAVSSALYGIKPVIVAVVAQAVWNLGRKSLVTWPLRALAVLAAAALISGVHELVVLAAAGSLGALLLRPPGSGPGRALSWAPLALLGPVAGAATPAAVGLPGLFWVFVKTGSVLFGSGYVLLAFLRADLVERLGWLTEAQLLDAVAVGQLTPGPVFTTATFIGYVLAGTSGALLATFGIFLPAFVFVALSGPLLPRLRRSASASAFLDAMNAASLAMMAVVSLQLGRAALVDAITLSLGVAAAVLLLRYRVSSSWLVLGGGAVGAIAGALGLIA